MGEKRKREDNLQKIKQALVDKNIMIEDKYDYTYYMYGYVWAYYKNKYDDFNDEVYHVYYNGYKTLTFCDEDDNPKFDISNAFLCYNNRE